MDGVTLARALHVLAVIHWLGGVAFVTAVLLPAVAEIDDPGRRLVVFEEFERRFSAQVRVSVPLAGLSGLYMVHRLDAWSRFLDPANWWLGAMAILWLVFMAILFVIEPLLARRLRRWARKHPEQALARLQRVHWLLLSALAIVAAGGVLGAHGFL